MDEIEAAFRPVVELLVRGDYDAVLRRCPESPLTAAHLREAIEEYGRTLIIPPDGAYDGLESVRVTVEELPTWAVMVPLWTKEEGRSDLTLELTMVFGNGEPEITIDNLHVL